MNLHRTLLALALLVSTGLILTGCAGGESESHDHDHDHDHDHAHHDHTEDHSDDHGHDHDHPVKNPHGGILVEVGEHVAHLEVVVEDDGTVSAYVLDCGGEKGIPIAQEKITLEVKNAEDGTRMSLELQAVASELTGETVGNTSEFRGKSGELAGLSSWVASIPSLEIKGQVFESLSFEYSKGN